MPSALTNFATARQVMDRWREDVLSGKPPVLYPAGEGALGSIEVGPGLVQLVGGAPGLGKTALVMQLVVDAMRITPALRVCVCNVEMTPAVLLDRQLARVSGIELTTIRRRMLGREHKERIDTGLATLDAVVDRLCFVKPPFELPNILGSADRFGDVGLIVLDYVQRIGVPGEHESKRTSVGVLMEMVRGVADRGAAVVAVSSVGRTRDQRGRSSYSPAGLGLASFKESGDLEYGADDAYLLVPNLTNDDQVILKHLKARHSEPRDLELVFDRPHQRFSDPALHRGADPNAADDLKAAWGRSAARPGGKL